MTHSKEAKALVASMAVTVFYAIYRLFNTLMFSDWTIGAELTGVIAVCLLSLAGAYGGYQMLSRRRFPFVLVSLFWAAQSFYLHGTSGAWDLGETPMLGLAASPEATSITVRLLPLAMYIVVTVLWLTQRHLTVSTRAGHSS